LQKNKRYDVHPHLIVGDKIAPTEVAQPRLGGLHIGVESYLVNPKGGQQISVIRINIPINSHVLVLIMREHKGGEQELTKIIEHRQSKLPHLFPFSIYRSAGFGVGHDG